MTRPHRLYGLFWTDSTGKAMWALGRHGRIARKVGKARKALVLSIPLPAGGGPWDAPTFRACADRVEGDYRS